jgi:hypothetical protein
MPLLDVSSVLDNPMFKEAPKSLIRVRNMQTVGEDGRAVNNPCNTPFDGVVTSDTGDVLTRLAEGSYIKGSIVVHTSCELIDGLDGKDADIVIWKGRQYTVSSVNDYSTYGRGFVAATCEPLKLSGG